MSGLSKFYPWSVGFLIGLFGDLAPREYAHETDRRKHDKLESRTNLFRGIFLSRHIATKKCSCFDVHSSAVGFLAGVVWGF
jgi:hypothetical protein